MTKQELKENLIRRIKNLSLIETDYSLSDWSIGYDTGYKDACKQILEIISNYE